MLNRAKVNASEIRAVAVPPEPLSTPLYPRTNTLKTLSVEKRKHLEMKQRLSLFVLSRVGDRLKFINPSFNHATPNFRMQNQYLVDKSNYARATSFPR